MVGCASQNDKTEKSREDTTVTYFMSKAKPVFAPVVVPVVKKGKPLFRELFILILTNTIYLNSIRF
jgi:hypothetical protein